MVIRRMPGRGAKYRSGSYVRGHQNGRYAHAKPAEIKRLSRERAARIRGRGARGRRDMIIAAAVLVERYHQQDVVVIGTGPDSLVYIRQKLLSAANVMRRVIVRRKIDREQPQFRRKAWFDE